MALPPNATRCNALPANATLVGMPGVRLTQEDRERIAAGLAEGLDYAEIARRLGRPTSTISREVARNLRPGGYQATEAHRATLQRRSARRAPSTTESESGLDKSVDSVAGLIGHITIFRDVMARGAGRTRDPQVTAEFDERFAALMVETGLPRMAARVLGALVTTDAGALTAAELVGRLRVSPASVSKAVGYLESLDVVRRERAPGRRERYVIDDDVWLQSWLTSARLHRMWGEAARDGAAVYGADTPAGVRLERMGRFFGSLSDQMTGGLDPQLATDLLTVVAALVHAVGPRTVEQLADALGWDARRVAAAVDLAERRSDIGDPVAPKAVPGGYVAVANEQRLTPAQRAALSGG